jgi:CheY-like chemotaxis protein
MKTILLVDDAADIRRLLSATLDPREYHIYEARDGAEAVAMCMEHRPDAAIIDVQMPGELDGIEATRRIKETPRTRDCQVVVLSGLGDDTYVSRALEAGAAAYLTKPFSPLELIDTIEKLVGIQ